MGTAFVEAGMHIANGLIVLAIVQGEGPLWSGVAFWLLAQVVLVVAGLLYEWITPHSVHSELERDNAAVGLAFGGVLVGMGNIVSIAVARRLRRVAYRLQNLWRGRGLWFCRALRHPQVD